MMRLADPWYLLLLVIPAFLFFLHLWQVKHGRASILFSSGSSLKGLPKTWRMMISPHLHWAVYPGFILMIIALARPQAGTSFQEIKTHGVDIMMILDTSGSMAEADMVSERRALTRLDAAKKVMARFIKGRRSDRIGLIAFASFSLTRCPLTLDYPLLLNLLDEVNIDLFPEEMRRTAIGNVIATGVTRLRESDAQSKIIIFLTDGTNTAGNVAPLTAADFAVQEDIKIYTIGFGSPDRTDVDEETLKEIASKTNGQYYRADSLEDLEQVYSEIDQLEKSEVRVKNYEKWRELFPWFLMAGCCFLIFEIVMSKIFCRRVP
ncbi:MAG: aerotolerance regulator BatA [Acidobacteria bacterium]|nr:MAG: aerotolerance regulator BatA [Acidobacteriota bacterium]